MKLEFSRQIFERCYNIKFNEIRSVGAELFHVDRRMDEQMDRQHEVNSRFSQFSNAPNKNIYNIFSTFPIF